MFRREAAELDVAARFLVNERLMENERLDAEDTQSDLTGRRLGAYVLIRRLGRGGMADVYLAEQSSLRRYVAIKVLKPSLAKNESFVKRFHHEAQAAAILVQANIVQIYEVGTIDGVHFIAQEYVRGQNLRQFIHRHGAVEPIVAINIIRQVAAALQKAAEYKVIHRDIKPENILLSPNGEVRVADFGLARINDPQRRNDLTQIGITMGTPLYMSPEQVEGKNVDSRSDIYSLGITAYHMLAGQPPFDGDSPLTIALQHVNKIPPSLSTLRPDVPPELIAIVEKAMAKLPADRFQDPNELLRAVRKIEVDFDQWESLVEKLAADSGFHEGAPTQLGESKHAVTKQLQSILFGQTIPEWKRPRNWIIAALIVAVAFGVGIVLAVLQPPQDIFAGVPDVVPQQASARDQYMYAFWQPELGEKGWKAVGQYFGSSEPTQSSGEISAVDLMFVRLADQRLGELYLENNDYDAAEQVYTRLANVESTEKYFLMVGHAGLAVVADAKGKPGQVVRDHLFQVDQLRSGLGARNSLNQQLENKLTELRGNYLLHD